MSEGEKLPNGLPPLPPEIRDNMVRGILMGLFGIIGSASQAVNALAAMGSASLAAKALERAGDGLSHCHFLMGVVSSLVPAEQVAEQAKRLVPQIANEAGAVCIRADELGKEMLEHLKAAQAQAAPDTGEKPS